MKKAVDPLYMFFNLVRIPNRLALLPMRRRILPLIQYFILRSKRLEVRVNPAVDLSFQPEMETLVQFVQKRLNRTPVVILDEVDRCSPEMAQAAVTLARRSLEHGVVTVLPYVESQLHHKAFNPLQIVSPDLYATAIGLLAKYYRPGLDTNVSVPEKASASDLGAYVYDSPESWIQEFLSQSSERSVTDGSEGQHSVAPKLIAGRGQGGFPVATAYRNYVDHLLIRHFVEESDERVKAALIDDLSEKFLASKGIKFRPATGEDVVVALESWPSLRPVLEAELGIVGLYRARLGSAVAVLSDQPSWTIRAGFGLLNNDDGEPRDAFRQLVDTVIQQFGQDSDLSIRRMESLLAEETPFVKTMFDTDYSNNHWQRNRVSVAFLLFLAVRKALS